MGDGYEDISYRVEGAAAVITLDRPDRLNAWTTRMGQELGRSLEVACADPDVVAIVLTGAGRAFCAGADMGMLESLSEGTPLDAEGGEAPRPGNPDVDPGYRRTYSYLASLDKPVIAAINGPCAGMAVPIACFCDMRFASDRASFLTAFVRRGLIAEWGSSWILPRLVGTAHAFDLLLSGRKVEADEALRMGLVNRVIPHDALIESTLAYVQMLAENSSPQSMRVMKRQIYRDLLRDLDGALSEANRLMLESIEGDDFKEGVRSFLERRPPRFPKLG